MNIARARHYTSIRACGTDWTGSTVGYFGMIRIDDDVYRWMGPAGDSGVTGVTKTVTQKTATVSPLNTRYTFQIAESVAFNVTWTTALKGHDKDLGKATRPVTFVTLDVKSIDGKEHAISAYFDTTGESVVANVLTDEVIWKRGADGASANMEILSIGTSAQNYLAQGTDRINWGYQYVAVPRSKEAHTVMTSSASSRGSFATSLNAFTSLKDDEAKARRVSDKWPVLAHVFDFGNLGANDKATTHFSLAIDEVFSMSYFGTAMQPLWKRSIGSAGAMLSAIEQEYEQLMSDTKAFDDDMIARATSVGGDKYATTTALVYRQSFGGTIAVWNNVTGKEWAFMKEISSDGDVSTVDVLYPAFPIFMLEAPEFFRKALLPLFTYAANETSTYGMKQDYNLAWAPHHLGHWPVCDLAPSRQEQMPMEESGNMLIMIAGIVQAQSGNAQWLAPYIEILDLWANYTWVWIEAGEREITFHNRKTERDSQRRSSLRTLQDFGTSRPWQPALHRRL